MLIQYQSNLPFNLWVTHRSVKMLPQIVWSVIEPYFHITSYNHKHWNNPNDNFLKYYTINRDKPFDNGLPHIAIIGFDKKFAGEWKTWFYDAFALTTLPEYHNQTFDNNPMHEHILWCYNHNIPVYLDESWEVLYTIFLNSDKIDHAYEYFKKYNVKMLCHFQKDIQKYYTNCTYNKKADELFIDTSDLFEFELRGRLFNNQFARQFEIDYYPKRLEETNYTFGSLIGDITKPKNIVLKSEMYRKGLFDNGYCYNINKEYLGRKTHLEYKKRVTSKYLLSKWDSVVKEHSYEDNHPLYETFIRHMESDNGRVDNTAERKIPPFLNDCLLHIICETHTYPFFYTEKTYKSILAGVPFVFYGAPFLNTEFAKKGYKIFDEIWDYSYEQGPFEDFNNYWFESTIETFIKQLQNLHDRTIILDNSKSIQEKVDYNRYLFLKRTTRDSMILWLKKLFDIS